MISLRDTTRDELALFIVMQEQPHARAFINPTSLEAHEQNFDDGSVIYLSIDKVDTGLVGYLMLVQEEDGQTVEFRRILIDQGQRGVGQAAIAAMEQYCRETLGAKRVWLDVYDDNDIGKHIYEKLGYRRFKTETPDDRLLHFYAKEI